MAPAITRLPAFALALALGAALAALPAAALMAIHHLSCRCLTASMRRYPMQRIVRCALPSMSTPLHSLGEAFFRPLHLIY